MQALGCQNKELLDPSFLRFSLDGIEQAITTIVVRVVRMRNNAGQLTGLFERVEGYVVDQKAISLNHHKLFDL